MWKWLSNLRRRHFPTRDERYQDGWDFARRELGPNPSEQAVDALYEEMWLGDDDPFDRGARAYMRNPQHWGRK